MVDSSEVVSTEVVSVRPRAPADPDRLLVWGVWIVVVLSALQLLLLPFGRDQGIYAVVGSGMIDGEVPYRDLWDFKTPAIYAVFAAAELLFGRSMASIRIVEIAGMIVVVLAMSGMARDVVGKRTPGLVGGAIAALIHAQLEFWHSAQPEVFAGIFTVLGLYFAIRSRSQPYAPWLLPVLVGCCFGIAFLFKPPHGGGAIVCAAYMARAERVRTARLWPAVRQWLVVGGASLLPIFATAAWFALVGGFGALWWTLFEFVPGYTSLSSHYEPLVAYGYAFKESFVGYSALAPVGVACAFVLRPMHGREREGLLLLMGVICLQVAGIAMQGKFFQYHYAATLPLVSFIGGVGLYKIWRRLFGYPIVGKLAFVSAVIALVFVRPAVRVNPGTFWERAALRFGFLWERDRDAVEPRLYYVADYDLSADRQVARYIRDRTEEDAKIFIWGFEPGIYWMAERTPASRYIYNVPQRATWNRQRARRALMEDLSESPPELIVVQHGDVFDWVTGDRLDSAQALPDFELLHELIWRDYSLSSQIEDFDIYRRRARERPET